MGKFIIITFAFMAFAFYEMSGGDDFVPIADEKRAALAQQAEASRLAQSQETAKRAESLVVASISTQDQTPEVTLASAVVPTPAAPANGTSTADKLNAAVALTNAAGTVTAQADENTAPKDLREVTAARVNMRKGPGRNFDVVTKLNSGDTVEILQDDGDGWVKLRVTDNGTIGWMADFLLTAANN